MKLDFNIRLKDSEVVTPKSDFNRLFLVDFSLRTWACAFCITQEHQNQNSRLWILLGGT